MTYDGRRDHLLGDQAEQADSSYSLAASISRGRSIKASSMSLQEPPSPNELDSYVYVGVWQKSQKPGFMRFVWTVGNTKAVLV